MTSARIRSGRPSFFLALWLGIICPSVEARAITLDDSGSQALEPSVRMRWPDSGPSRISRANVLIGTTAIRVRINVMPWLHRSVRIYLTLPMQQPGPVDMSWTTQGQFLSGQLHSGNRTLVYAGLVNTPVLEEMFLFKFVANSALLSRAVPLTYHFEMDEP